MYVCTYIRERERERERENKESASFSLCIVGLTPCVFTKKSETLKIMPAQIKGHAARARDRQSTRERGRENDYVVARHASRGAHSELADALDHGIFDDVVFIVLAGRRQ